MQMNDETFIHFFIRHFHFQVNGMTRLSGNSNNNEAEKSAETDSASASASAAAEEVSVMGRARSGSSVETNDHFEPPDGGGQVS